MILLLERQSAVKKISVFLLARKTLMAFINVQTESENERFKLPLETIDGLYAKWLLDVFAISAIHF